MNDVRRAALRNLLIALALMAPVWAYLLAVDYSSRRLWTPRPAFIVAFLMPGFIALLRSGYALIMGRPGPAPLFGPWPKGW